MNERKEQLIANCKLVLVLDLDNTLLHSTEYNLKPEFMKQIKDRPSGIQLVDSVRSIYHVWNGLVRDNKINRFSFLIKLRPFCKEFLLDAMKNYDLYFYTAATRKYGEFCLKIFKVELTRD